MPDAMSRDPEVVPDAVLAWWRARRPVGWTEEQHRENPTVNCVSEPERQLALHAAGYRVVALDDDANANPNDEYERGYADGLAGVPR